MAGTNRRKGRKRDRGIGQNGKKESSIGQEAVALHAPPSRKAELNFKLRCIGTDLGARKKRCRMARVPVVGADEYAECVILKDSKKWVAAP